MESLLRICKPWVSGLKLEGGEACWHKSSDGQLELLIQDRLILLPAYFADVPICDALRELIVGVHAKTICCRFAYANQGSISVERKENPPYLP